MTMIITIALVIQSLFGQEVDTVLPEGGAYLISDPVRNSWIGVATQVGRFSAKLALNCDGYDIGQNVNIGSTADGVVYVIEHPVMTDADHICYMIVGPQMSSVLCFTNDDGACDVALETD